MPKGPSEEEIKNQHKIIEKYWAKYLKKLGVALPALENSKGSYNIIALVLVYLSLGYPETKKVTKKELTQFIRRFYPEVNDVQQGRHLGAQHGWYVLSGGRDNIVLKLKRGEYQLYSLEQSYPGFKKDRRAQDIDNWDEIKKLYGYRCATCGSREGEAHFHWPDTKTKIERGHKDPNLPLTKGNIIPQCQKCNRGDRNRWVYDEKGRVTALSFPKHILKSNPKVVKEVYTILYNKFNGNNPNEKGFN